MTTRSLLSPKFALLATMLVGGCASDPVYETKAVAPSPIVLEPGDVVRLAVWREKDLAGDFEVDERGHLTLPMLGVFDVKGKAWEPLRDSLTSGFQRELKNTSITLTPLRRILVLGMVPKPGQYFIDPTLSLAGAVAMAGGATAEGDIANVRVVRDGRTIVQHASIETQLLQGSIHSNDEIFVEPRSWVALNIAFLTSAALSVAGIAVTILLRY